MLFYVLLLNKKYHKVDTINLEENSITAFLFYFNFKLINDNNNYFSSQNVNLILNFWSLSVEEQYYLFIGILSLILIYMSNKISISIQLVIILFSYILFHIEIKKYYIFSFYSIFTRLWEFGCGSLIYYYNIKSINKYMMVICIFLQIILMALNIKHYICFTIINIITFIQIMYSTNNEESIIPNNINILNFIGKMSYAIYLIHYSNILIFSKLKAILYTVLCSVILHYLVEKPLRTTSHDYILVIAYSICVLIYYKIYNKDYLIAVQKKNIEKDFVKDMCSYDILDNFILSKYSILLLGDSHTLHFIRTFYDNSHKVILYHSYISDLNVLYNNNYDFGDMIYLFKYKFDLVIISFWISHNRNISYENAIYKLINKIENITNNVLFISDNPMFNLNPNGCSASSKYCYGIVNVNCSIMKPYDMSQFKYSKYLSVYDYNTNKYTVNGNKCPFEINGISIYRDFQHFNGFFVENYLMKDIHNLLNKIFKQKLWKDISVKSVKYHCLEKEHNIYRGVCVNNRYKILKIKSKEVKEF